MVFQIISIIINIIFDFNRAIILFIKIMHISDILKK